MSESNPAVVYIIAYEYTLAVALELFDVSVHADTSNWECSVWGFISVFIGL